MQLAYVASLENSKKQTKVPREKKHYIGRVFDWLQYYGSSTFENIIEVTVIEIGQTL